MTDENLAYFVQWYPDDPKGIMARELLAARKVVEAARKLRLQLDVVHADVSMAKIVKLEKKLCGGIKNSTRTKKNGQS